jgi:hypothetical protein
VRQVRHALAEPLPRHWARTNGASLARSFSSSFRRFTWFVFSEAGLGEIMLPDRIVTIDAIPLIGSG